MFIIFPQVLSQRQNGVVLRFTLNEKVLIQNMFELLDLKASFDSTKIESQSILDLNRRLSDTRALILDLIDFLISPASAFRKELKVPRDLDLEIQQILKSKKGLISNWFDKDQSKAARLYDYDPTDPVTSSERAERFFHIEMKQLIGTIFIEKAAERARYIEEIEPTAKDLRDNFESYRLAIWQLNSNLDNIDRNSMNSFSNMKHVAKIVELWYKDRSDLVAQIVAKFLEKQKNPQSVGSTNQSQQGELTKALVQEEPPLSQTNTILQTAKILAISSERDPVKLNEKKILDESSLMESLEDFRSLFGLIEEFTQKFVEAQKKCSDVSTFKSVKNAYQSGTIFWQDALQKEFEEIQQHISKDALAESLKQLTPKQANESDKEFAERLASVLVNSNVLTHQRRIRQLLRKVEEYCPEDSASWFELDELPSIEFEFEREPIPKSINDWLVAPLKKKQKPKTVVWFMLSNGGSFPEFKVGDTIKDDWKVKIIEQSQPFANNAIWTAGQIFVQRLGDANASDLFGTGNFPFGVPDTNDPRKFLEAIKQRYRDIKAVGEPLVAAYMQQITQCHYFIGIQQPSEDDDDYISDFGIGEGIKSSISIASNAAQTILRVGWDTIKSTATNLVYTGLKKFLSGLWSIMSYSISSALTVLTKVTLQSGVPRLLKRLLFEHPYISTSIVTMASIGAPVLLSSLLGYDLSNIAIPNVAVSSWFFLKSFVFGIVSDLGLPTSAGITSYFFSLSGIIQLLHATLCSTGYSTAIIQFLLKYYFIHNVLGGLRKRISESKFALAASFFDMIFGSVFSTMISAACGPLSNVLAWAWNQTSSLFTAFTKQSDLRQTLSIEQQLNTMSLSSEANPLLATASNPTNTDGLTMFTEVKRDVSSGQTILQSQDGTLFRAPTSQLDKVFQATNGRNGFQESAQKQLETYLSNVHGIDPELAKVPRQGFLKWSDVDFQFLSAQELGRESVVTTPSRLFSNVQLSDVTASEEPLLTKLPTNMKQQLSSSVQNLLDKVELRMLEKREQEKLLSDSTASYLPSLKDFSERAKDVFSRFKYKPEDKDLQPLFKIADDYSLSWVARDEELTRSMKLNPELEKNINEASTNLFGSGGWQNFLLASAITIATPIATAGMVSGPASAILTQLVSIA